MRKIILYTLLTTVTSLQAGAFKFTHHSRANCMGFNESISWDGRRPHTLYVSSLHLRFAKHKLEAHIIDSGQITKTHRAGAFHATEAYATDGWEVHGNHRFYPSNTNRQSYKIILTDAKDCNISSGWLFKNRKVNTTSQEQTDLTFKDKEEFDKWYENEYLHGQKRGSVRIISPEKIIEETKQDANDIKSMQNTKNSIKKLGYNDNEDEDIDLLKDIEYIAKNDLEKYGNDINGTHMKRDISEIKLGYKFKGIPSDADLKSISFVPAVTYIDNVGWSGAVQFFIAKDTGNCSLEEENLKLSGSMVTLSNDIVTKDVNGKTTTVEIIGTKQKGFVYNVTWYDDTLARTLKCYNKNFSDSIKLSIIELAKRIDK